MFAMIHRKKSTTRGRHARRAALPLAAAIVLAAGCESMLEVENPNNVLQEDLEEPGSANAVVNGALSTVARAMSNVLRGHAALTDEYDWVGSWNAAGELDGGQLDNTANDFTNTAFNDMSIARWLADNAVGLLEGFDAEGTLPRRIDLARAYIYSGITYMTIPDMWDDFALSNRTEAAPPIGTANMVQLYDTAIERFDAGRAVAQAEGDDALALTALALRARAHWAKALWTKLHPKGQVPADPLIDDAAANADAAAVIAALNEPDWKFRFNYSATTIDNTAGSWFNSRLEMRVGDAYAIPDETDKKISGIRLEDPIDAIPDPALEAITDEFIDGHIHPPLTLVGAREMHLILAEAALAAADTTVAVTHINHVRAFEGLTPYDPATHAVTPLEMLRHTRRVNLFLQVQRRLGDLYRFGIQVADWIPGSEAMTTPGTLFPIGEEERLSNCYINGSC